MTSSYHAYAKIISNGLVSFFTNAFVSRFNVNFLGRPYIMEHRRRRHLSSKSCRTRAQTTVVSYNCFPYETWTFLIEKRTKLTTCRRFDVVVGIRTIDESPAVGGKQTAGIRGTISRRLLERSQCYNTDGRTDVWTRGEG